jgi:hypothetical protein
MHEIRDTRSNRHMFNDLLCYLVGVPGALFWFAPLQRNRTRSPSCKVRASAVLRLKSAHVRFWHLADMS